MASVEGCGFPCNAAIALSRRSLRVRRIASRSVSPASIWNGISVHGVAEICYRPAILTSSLELTDLFRGVVDFRNFLRNETLKDCAFAGLDLVGCRDGFGLDLGRTTLNAGQIGGVTSLRCL